VNKNVYSEFLNTLAQWSVPSDTVSPVASCWHCLY